MSTVRLVVQPIAIAVALAFAVRASSIGIYSIPSSSMEPTLQVGDTIVVTPYLFGQHPSPGDVIVFRSPSARGEMVVKRVVAAAGDLIESRDGRMMLRGHALAEPYLPHGSVTTAVAAQVVPASCYFVLGDNRLNSQDSRQWGVIDGGAIVGRARLVLWSSPAPGSAPQAQAAALTRTDAPQVLGMRLFRVVR